MTEFPLFLTVEEAQELIDRGCSLDLWHKLNNFLSIMKTGEPCCEENP